MKGPKRYLPHRALLELDSGAPILLRGLSFVAISPLKANAFPTASSPGRVTLHANHEAQYAPILGSLIFLLGNP